MGRTLTDSRTTNSVTKSTVYAYLPYVDGSVNTISYPSGRTLSYSTGAAERLLYVQDNSTSVYYANGAHYVPFGSLSSLTNGSSYYSTQIYNDRLQPCWLYATTGTALATTTLCSGTATPGNILDLKYNYSLGVSDNGNVMGIANNRDTTRTQSFGYDALNRLDLAETTSTYATSPTNCWGEIFQYDNPSKTVAWGNLTAITAASSAYTGCVQQSMSMTATTQNQLQDTNNDYVYDAAGNLINISSLDAYSYDAEDRLVSTAGVNYLYDGDGRRVAKASGTTVNKIYWYGAEGEVLDETDGTGSISNPAFTEYIFFGGQRIAYHDSSNNVFYYFSDHLGTSRTMVQSSQTTLCYDADFYPFGVERTPIINTCQQNYKFTGKERDSESGLDNFGARYDASSMGRFMSPDPGNAGAEHESPQSWNAYSYVVNNPINAVDPDGLDCVYAGDFKNSGTVTIERGDSCSSAGGTYVEGHIDETSFVYDQKNNQLTYNVSDTGASGVISVGPSNAGIGDSDRFAAVQMGVGLGEQGVNWAVRTTLINAGGAAAGGLIAYGAEAILAARAARVVAAAAEAADLTRKAASTVGNQGATASSEAVALAAAEEWVGQGARPIVDRTTGQVVGKISADGTKVYRITSINKAQPYVNLVNRTTGGNLHVRF